MAQADPGLDTWAAHVYRVTHTYWSGLFHGYDDLTIPRTNNDLEQYFGTARHHERRATGRKRPPAGDGAEATTGGRGGAWVGTGGRSRGDAGKRSGSGCPAATESRGVAGNARTAGDAPRGAASSSALPS